MATNIPVLILAISWAETALGLVFFLLRFVSNWKITRRFNWDLALAGLTVATQCTAQIMLQLSVNEGLGRHIHDLSAAQQAIALKWGWAFQLLAIAASALGKLAILTFLMLIRGRHEKRPWLLIVLAVLIAAVNIAVLGTILGQCKPMAKLWDNTLEGTCDPGRKLNQDYSFFQASFNTVSDAILATYPIHLFWRLQMKLRLKVALSVLMGFGWIASICSLVKCYELKALTQTTDTTYELTSLIIWASTEAWIIIIVGCVPPMRPLLQKLLQHFGLTSKKSSTPYRSPGGNYGFDSNRFKGTGNSGYQSGAYSSRRPWGRDDEAWMELEETRARDGSQEQIIGGKDVVVTTDIVTRVEQTPTPGPVIDDHELGHGDDHA